MHVRSDLLFCFPSVTSLKIDNEISLTWILRRKSSTGSVPGFNCGRLTSLKGMFLAKKLAKAVEGGSVMYQMGNPPSEQSSKVDVGGINRAAIRRTV
jgi:hypothetical protein